MEDNKLVCAIENFDKIKSEIMSDASIVASENGCVIYVRVVDIDDEYGIGTLLTGKTPVLIYAISHIIVKLARRSGHAIPTIIKAIYNTTIDIKDEV